jgi:hypothetical protein
MKTSKRLLRTRVPRPKSRAQTLRVALPHQMRPAIAICSRDQKRRGQRRKRLQPRKATRDPPRKRKRRRLAKMTMTMRTKGRRRRSPRKPRLRNLCQSQKVATQKTRWRSTRSPRSPRPNQSRDQHQSAKPRRGMLMDQQRRSKRKQETDTRISLSHLSLCFVYLSLLTAI